ncbi:MAG: VCBS repeat-containing protein [Chitinophagaceae bacterium]|nr:VCBS repeat-containing protein [Chitinophagaceae bacterium]
MRRNCLGSLLIIFFVIKLQAQTHVISSFSPTSGPVGTTVIINGSGFNPVADSNKVLFGHLKAAITNASATSLTVTVPAKATYNYITVVTSGPNTRKYSAVSNLPFDVTFEDDSVIVPNSFNIETIIYDTPLGSANSSPTFIGDFDSDEKLDFAAGKAKFRNISPDTPAFNQPVYMPGYLSTPPYPTYIEGSFKGCGDINGDGLPDLFVNARNIGSDFGLGYLSTAGDFDSVATSWSIGFVVNKSVFFTDLSNDGFPDAIYDGISVSNTNGYGLHGVVGSTDCLYSNSRDCYSYFYADLDGDGYKDVVGGFDYDTYGTAPGIEFYRNGFPGSGSFITRNNISDITFPTPPTAEKPVSIKGGDFNGDGKVDLVIGINGQGMSLLINSGTPGTMSFLPQIQFPGITANITAVNDINGDSKPDIIGTGYIYKNTSTGNDISFAPGVPCPNGIIGDFDGDGKQDFLVLNENRRSVFRHNPVSNRKLCPGSNVSFSTPVHGSIFQWQLNTGSGFANITDNAVYSGTNSPVLQVSNIPSSSYGYEYRCLVDNNPCGQFKVTFENKWFGTTGNAWETPANWSCGTIPDASTDVIIDSGTVIVNTSTTIRSLTVSPSANFTVAPGVLLTITH